MSALLLAASLAALAQPTADLLYPRGASITDGDPLVLVRASDNGQPWTERPGRYITAVLVASQRPRQEVARLALHDDGRPPDAVAADGVWSAARKGLRLPPGEYLVNLAIQPGSGARKKMMEAAGSLSVEGGLAEPRFPLGLLWAVLVVSTIAAGCGVLAVTRRAMRGRAAAAGPATDEAGPVLASRGAWAEAIAAADRIGDTVRAAFTEWQQSCQWADSIAQQLARTLDTLEQLEQMQGWKLGAVKQDIERALQRMGWERWEPEVGGPPPREAEQWPTNEGEVEPGTVASVISPGFRRQRGESTEVLKPPVVTVKQ